MKFKVLLVLSASLIFCFGTAKADNPFLTAPKKEVQTVTKKNPLYPAVLQKVIRPLLKVQRQLHEKMSCFVRKLKNNPSAETLLLLFGIAFLYGVIHATGPGHGKIFAVSYFISGKTEIKKGAVLGTLIAFMHVGTSIVMVLVIYSVVRSTLLNHFEDTTRIISLISYGLITLIGLTLLFLKIGKMIRNGMHGHIHAKEPALSSDKSLISVALVTGFVPCPGTILLLLFTLSQNMLVMGILLSLAIAAGMAITISLAGIAAIIFRQMFLEMTLKTNQVRIILSNSLEFAGSTAIVLLGGFLFLSSI